MPSWLLANLLFCRFTMRLDRNTLKFNSICLRKWRGEVHGELSQTHCSHCIGSSQKCKFHISFYLKQITQYSEKVIFGLVEPVIQALFLSPFIIFLNSLCYNILVTKMLNYFLSSILHPSHFPLWDKPSQRNRSNYTYHNLQLYNIYFVPNRGQPWCQYVVQSEQLMII